MKKNYLKCLSVFALATTLMLTGIGCSNNSSNPTTIPSQSTSDENTNNSLNNSSNDSKEQPSKDNSNTNSSSKEDSENTINNEYLKLFNMTLDNSNFIYGLNDEYAQFKLCDSDNIISIRYLDTLDSYITLESSNSNTIYDMYLINSSNEKILISNNMTKDNFKYFTLESKGNLYYLTDSNNLYCYNKENNKESKVESNVYKFDIANSGDIVINTSDTLYIINTKGDKTILSSHGKCGVFYIDNNKIIYLEDNCICYYDMSKSYSEIIEETDIIPYNTDYSISFNGNDGFLYYINYTYETIDNSLKYKTYNGDTITIASNIENYALAEGGVYYTKYTEEFINHNNYIESAVLENDYLTDYGYQGDMYEGIYYFDFLSNKYTKISEYNKLIETTNINSPTASIQDEGGNVYMISNDGTIKQSYGTINQGYEIYEEGENSYIKYVPYTPIIFKDYTVILSTNGELYFDNSIIASNVDFILSSGDNLAYITKDNKIYLIDENEEIHLIIEDATKYNKVFFNEDLLYIK